MIGVSGCDRGCEASFYREVDVGNQVGSVTLGFDLCMFSLSDCELAGIAGEFDGEVCCALKIHSATVSRRQSGRRENL